MYPFCMAGLFGEGSAGESDRLKTNERERERENERGDGAQ